MAASKQTSLTLAIRAETRSSDGWWDYARLLEDGALTIDVHYGYDYHAQGHLTDSKAFYAWLVAHGFRSPVGSYDAYTRTSGALTRTLDADGRNVLVEVRLFLALFPLGGVLCLLIPALIVNRATWRNPILRAGYIFPAFVLSVTALIMLDNLTYTIFKVGIITSTGALRISYAFGFILVYPRSLSILNRNKWMHGRPASFIALCLLAASTIGFTAIYLSNDPDLRNPYTESTKGNYPNIIILGSDGLSAKYLSAYGYPLETTPFLSELREKALFAENAFPNASSTTASTASMLTGRESTEVRVFRYPDILSGRDS